MVERTHMTPRSKRLSTDQREVVIGKARTSECDMDNYDVFRAICVMLTDEALYSLFTSGFADSIRKLLAENAFWKERAEFLTQRDLALDGDVDWNHVYRALEDVTRHPDRLPLLSGLDYLPSLLAIMQVHRTPQSVIDPGSQRMLWRNLANPDAMHFLLDQGTLILGRDAEMAKYALGEAALRDRPEMVESTLALIPEHMRRSALVRNLANAAESKSISMFKLLLGKVVSERQLADDERWKIVADVAKFGSSEILTYFLPFVTIPLNWTNVASQAVVGRNMETLRLLDRKLSDQGRWDLIKLSIHVPIDDDRDIIFFLLDGASDDVIGMALKEAATTDTAAFATVLAYPRSNPNRDLEWLVTAVQSDQKAIDMLLRDSRVQVENLFSPVLWQLVPSLSAASQDKIKGFEAGAAAVGVHTNDAALISLMREETLYATLLRVIVMKRPMSEELADWMIAREDRKIELAARQALMGEWGGDEELIAVKALLWSMLYSTRTHSDLLQDLRLEGVSEQALIDSAQLLGAWLGAARLR